MSEDDVADVLRQRLRDLAGQIRRGDAMVRDGDPEGVHDLRVAMRRTRSLLRTFRPVLPEPQRADTELLREELRWAGGELGAARDAEIIRQRVGTGRTSAATDPATTVPGALGPEAARELLEQRLNADEARASARSDALLDSDRYRRLLDAVDAAASEVDWSAAAGPAVRDPLRKDWRRMHRRARAADRAAGGPGAEREARLHDVRKVAKRARYAAEALTPALGRKAARMAAAAEQVQESLGTHRDTLLTRRLLAELAQEAGDAGDAAAGFTLGRLHAQEEAAGDAALAAYRDARAEIDRKRHRRWLR